MSYFTMQTVPGLFVGRREVLQARPVEDGGEAYRCGGCDNLMSLPEERPGPREFVVRCGCGEFNQLTAVLGAGAAA
jgi:hypothetical protein